MPQPEMQTPRLVGKEERGIKDGHDRFTRNSRSRNRADGRRPHRVRDVWKAGAEMNDRPGMFATWREFAKMLLAATLMTLPLLAALILILWRMLP